MSRNDPRQQPDPISDFNAGASSRHQNGGDLWAAFQAAQGRASQRDRGSAPVTDEQLPPGDDGPAGLRPLQQQFQEQEQRPPDPTSAFDATGPLSRPGDPAGMSNEQLPPDDGGPVDLRPLRIRFQEGER
jgi:hypothetical protein